MFHDPYSGVKKSRFCEKTAVSSGLMSSIDALRATNLADELGRTPKRGDPSGAEGTRRKRAKKVGLPVEEGTVDMKDLAEHQAPLADFLFNPKLLPLKPPPRRKTPGE